MFAIAETYQSQAACLTGEQAREFSGAVVRWFKRHGRTFPWRQQSLSLYRLLVAEILLKRTAVGPVPKVYKELVSLYPRPRLLADANIEELSALLSAVGLNRQKALHLKEMSEQLVQRRQMLMWTEAELSQLPGVGAYTVAIVQAVKWGRPKVGVDTNVVRVLSRVFGVHGSRSEDRKSPEFQAIADVLASSIASESAALNWGLIDLGAFVCRPNTPRCEVCPVRKFCGFAGFGNRDSWR